MESATQYIERRICCQDYRSETLRKHSNIVVLVDFYETVDTFHVVIELARGGDLMRRISRRKRYTESDGRMLAREFLSAIEHIHKCNVVHRDLKPDNILLESDGDDRIGIKVADFGFAKELPKGGHLKSRCGTPAYVAPEICVGVPYGKGVDIWSCGVILYLLLSGKIPFIVQRAPGRKHDLKALFLKIRAADYVFDEQDWDKISMGAKSLIARMLTVDTQRRMTIHEALKSPWMIKKDDELGLSDSVHLDKTITNLKSFNARRSLRSAMIATTFVTTAAWFDTKTVTFMSKTSKLAGNLSVGSNDAPSTPLTSTAKTVKGGKVGQTFNDLYRMKEKIRDGEVGHTVWKGVKLMLNENGTKMESKKKYYAIKEVKRNVGAIQMSTEDGKVLNEVSILQSLSHYHVVQLFDFMEEANHFYLVMELMGGGDLFERIVTKEMYTEKDAREVAKALLSAVDYIHQRGVAHRDLKPQNLLLATRDNDTYMKVGDFGFAKRVHTPKSLFTRCGTPTYVAPEILKGHPYDQSVDMWSVGVIIYVALVGYPPFLEQNQRLMLEKIRHGQFEFYDEDWSSISEHARNLIQNLLRVDPDRRLSASDALNHDWIAHIDADELVKTHLKGSLDKLTRRSSVMTITSEESSTPFKSFSTLPN